MNKRSSLFARIDHILMVSTKVLAYIAAAFLFVIMLIAFVDACLGKLFALSIPHANEFIQYSGVPIVFFGVAYTQMLGQHTKIELLTSKFSPAVRRVLAVIMDLLGFALCVFLTLRGIVHTGNIYASGMVSGTISGFRVFPFPAMMTIGWASWAITLLWSAVKTIAGYQSPEHALPEGDIEDDI